MIVYRQKEFTSLGLKFKARTSRAGRNMRFLGNVGMTAAKNLKDSAIHLGSNPMSTGGHIMNSVVQDNKDTLKMMGGVFKDLGRKDVSTAKKLGIVANVATDMNPKTAFGKHLAQEVHHLGGKSGKDMVHSLSEFAANPLAKTGQKMADFRQGGHGGTYLGGKWLGPGTNKWCLGLAPDSIVTGAGKAYEVSKGKAAIQQTQQALANSRDARGFAWSYDRTVGKVLHPLHESVGAALGTVPTAINKASAGIKNSKLGQTLQPAHDSIQSAYNSGIGWAGDSIGKVKSFFSGKLKPQPQIV